MEPEFDRQSAKKSINSSRERSDPELDDVLNSASKFQLEIVRENNRHTEAKISSDLGFFGKYLGGEQNSPTFIASIAMLAGFITAAFSLYMAAHDTSAVDFWGKQVERAMAFSSAALAFIFGRGSNK